MESQEERVGTDVSSGGASEKPNMRMVHYYYINYREFANVVKYKLHRMRHKLEEESSKAVGVVYVGVVGYLYGFMSEVKCEAGVWVWWCG